MKKTEGGTTMYYVTFGPDIIAEYTGSGTLGMKHIYAAGGRVATFIPGVDTYYTAADQILSNRTMVDENGNNDQATGFTPYGQARSQSGALSDYLFIGKSEHSRDPGWSGEQGAGGLYYFGARYYRSAAEIRLSARL